MVFYQIQDKFETVITQNEQTLLRGLVNAITPLNEDEWSGFTSIWSPLSMPRKEVLTAIGDTEKYLYVVLEGVQRVYYLDDTNREATLVFTYPPSFGGVLDSFLLQ